MRSTKQKLVKNDFSGVDLRSLKKPPFFEYQQEIATPRFESELWIKSRQIGFSYAFSWRVLYCAAVLGRNQICISASKKQVGILRRYVWKFAREFFNVRLSGKEETEIISHKGGLASIHWCSNNSYTAQGYSGDLILDEFPQNPKAEQIYDAAMPTVSLGDYSIWAFGAPSHTQSFAYYMWRGKDSDGNTIGDGFKRDSINIYQAIDRGNHLINLEKCQKLCKTPDHFKNWYECEWTDVGNSLFKKESLEKTFWKENWKSESGEIYSDYAEIEWNPFETESIIVGYDPNGGGESGDQAGFIVLEEHRSQCLRVIEHHTMCGKLPDWQYGHMKRVLSKYTGLIRIIAVDCTGPGARLAERMRGLKADCFPQARLHEIDYNYSNKNAMVWHVERLIAEGKLKMNYNDENLQNAFYSVKIGVTHGGISTIRSVRSGTSHGELFWALTNAAAHYELSASGESRQSSTSYASA